MDSYYTGADDGLDATAACGMTTGVAGADATEIRRPARSEWLTDLKFRFPGIYMTSWDALVVLVVGAVLGAVFLSLRNNVTPLVNIPDATKQALYGAILLIAVATYAATQRGGFRRSGG